MDIKQLEEDKRRAEQHLQQIRANIEKAQEKEKLERQEPLRQLAIKAHDGLCTYNHTDGCGWGYETKGDVHSWLSHAHKRWLDKIESILTEKTFNAISQEQLEIIIDAAIDLKTVHPNAIWIVDRLRKV